jgi:hypothetical protein
MMYKFEPNQSKEQIFQVVFWLLLVERYQEIFDHQLTELEKQIDWALAASMALLSAVILHEGTQTSGVTLPEKLFLGALLGSVMFGLAAKLWSPPYRFSRPTNTPVRAKLAEMISPTLQEGFFKEMDFYSRRSACFEVGVNLNMALKLGKRVPKKIRRGADESVEALKWIMLVIKCKSRLRWMQLGCTFLAIAGFSIWLLVGS